MKSRGWPKGKKRYPKMPGAPKQPLSGYVHFLNDRREDVRKECPDISFADISKKLAVEWSNLDADTKQKYVVRAEQDKERYAKEFAEYQKTDNYKNYMDEQEKKQKKQEAKDPPPPKKKAKKGSGQQQQQQVKKEPAEEEGEASDHSFSGAGTDFPLFTEEFLEFNKGRESELKRLRKQVAEMEEQNAVLERHVQNMQSAIGKLEAETAQQQENSAALSAHLDSLRRTVVREMQGVRLPGARWSAEAVTMENVDELLRAVHAKLEQEEQQQQQGGGNKGKGKAASAEDAQLLEKVREVIGRINYEGIVQ